MIKKILRLLKKYDVFDVISFGIFLTIVATLAFFFLRKSKYVSVIISVSSSDILQEMEFAKSPGWYMGAIEIGLKEKDLLGRTNIEILDVLYYPNNNKEKTVFVEVKIRSVYNKNKNQYSYDGTPLLIGSFQTFELENIKIPGIIHSIGEKKQEYKIYKIKGEFEKRYNEDVIYQEHITSSQPGIVGEGLLEYLHTKIPKNINLHDSKNNLILKTTNLRFEPAYLEFLNGFQIKKVANYKRKRVFMDVFILAKKVNKTFFFREENQLQIDSQIPIHTELLTLELTILDIEEATIEETKNFFLYSQE